MSSLALYKCRETSLDFIYVVNVDANWNNRDRPKRVVRLGGDTDEVVSSVVGVVWNWVPNHRTGNAFTPYSYLWCNSPFSNRVAPFCRTLANFADGNCDFRMCNCSSRTAMGL